MARLRITIDCDSRGICDAHLTAEHLTTVFKDSPDLLLYLLEKKFEVKVEILPSEEKTTEGWNKEVGSIEASQYLAKEPKSDA